MHKDLCNTVQCTQTRKNEMKLDFILVDHCIAIVTDFVLQADSWFPMTVKMLRQF